MAEHVQVTPRYRARETPSGLMPVVLAGEGRFHRLGQSLTLGVLLLMVEKDVRPLMLAPAVHVDEYGPFVGAFLIAAERVYLRAALFEPAYLIKWDRASHAGLPLAVGQHLLVAYPVFRVLYDDMDGSPPLHEVTGEPQHDVVGVLVLVQLVRAHFPYRPRIRSSMPADQVEASPFQLGGDRRIACLRLPEQRLVILPFGSLRRLRCRLGCRGSLLRLRASQRGQRIFHPLEQAVVLAEPPFVQADKFFLVGLPGAVEALQEERDAFPFLRIGPLLRGQRGSRREEQGENENNTVMIFHDYRQLFMDSRRKNKENIAVWKTAPAKKRLIP